MRSAMSRKAHWVLVKVTAPTRLSAAQVRREVRTLVNGAQNFLCLDLGDIRAAAVRPAKPPYAWDTREEAERMLRMTHADPAKRDAARIVELEGEG